MNHIEQANEIIQAINNNESTADCAPNLWYKEDANGNVTSPVRIYLGDRGAWGSIQVEKDGTANTSKVKRQASQRLSEMLEAAGFTVKKW